MLSEEFVRLTRCMHTGSPLRLMDETELQRLNDAIRAGNVRNMLEEPISRELDGGLVDSASQFVYPIRDGIPVLMRDEALQVAEVLRSKDEDESQTRN